MSKLDRAPDQAIVLAWLGAAHLALGDWETAHRLTGKATAMLDSIGNVTGDFPPQEAWWQYYRTVEDPEQAWQVLQKTHQIMLDTIAALSDVGLRRNYLNKVKTNRAIVLERQRKAQARGLAISAEATLPGNLQGQFQRLLTIGVRMNEVRELYTTAVTGLLDFIMEQLIELSGAERAVLIQVDEAGKRRLAVAFGYADRETEEPLNVRLLEQYNELLDDLAHAPRPLLVDSRSLRLICLTQYNGQFISSAAGRYICASKTDFK